MQKELFLVDRPPQLGDEGEPRRAVFVPLRHVDLAATVIFLGQIHRNVGALQQRFDILAVLRVDRNADRGREIECDPVDRDRVS